MAVKKIFQKDKDCVYVWCNEHYAKDLNIKPADIAGKTDFDFHPKAMAEKYCLDDQRVMETSKTEDIEEDYIASGEKFWVHTIKTAVLDKNGEVVGVLGIFWDTTEEREAQKVLEESEKSKKRFEDLVNNLNVGVYRNTPGPEGIFLEVNPAMIKMFDAESKEQLLDLSVNELYVDSSERKNFSDKLSKKGFVKNEELRLKTLKDRIFYASVSAVAKKDEKGQVFFDGAIEDISARKDAEERLKNKIEELEQMNKLMVGRELKMMELKKSLQQARLPVGKAQDKKQEEKNKK